MLGEKGFTPKVTILPVSAKLIWNPLSFVKTNFEEAKKIFYIIESLEQNDDVQNIYTNLEISDETMKKLDGNL